CHALDTGVTESLATQKSNRRTGMSSRASEWIPCVNLPTAAVTASSGVTKYLADTRGETPSHARPAPLYPSPRSPVSTNHDDDGRHRSSTNNAPEVGRWCNA